MKFNIIDEIIKIKLLTWILIIVILCILLIIINYIICDTVKEGFNVADIPTEEIKLTSSEQIGRMVISGGTQPLNLNSLLFFDTNDRQLQYGTDYIHQSSDGFSSLSDSNYNILMNNDNNKNNTYFQSSNGGCTFTTFFTPPINLGKIYMRNRITNVKSGADFSPCGSDIPLRLIDYKMQLFGKSNYKMGYRTENVTRYKPETVTKTKKVDVSNSITVDVPTTKTIIIGYTYEPIYEDRPTYKAIYEDIYEERWLRMLANSKGKLFKIKVGQKQIGQEQTGTEKVKIGEKTTPITEQRNGTRQETKIVTEKKDVSYTEEVQTSYTEEIKIQIQIPVGPSTEIIQPYTLNHNALQRAPNYNIIYKLIDQPAIDAALAKAKAEAEEAAERERKRIEAETKEKERQASINNILNNVKLKAEDATNLKTSSDSILKTLRDNANDSSFIVKTIQIDSKLSQQYVADAIKQISVNNVNIVDKAEAEKIWLSIDDKIKNAGQNLLYVTDLQKKIYANYLLSVDIVNNLRSSEFSEEKIRSHNPSEAQIKTYTDYLKTIDNVVHSTWSNTQTGMSYIKDIQKKVDNIKNDTTYAKTNFDIVTYSASLKNEINEMNEINKKKNDEYRNTMKNINIGNIAQVPYAVNIGSNI